MAMAVAGQVAAGEMRIRDCANVDTSFPGFLALAQETGMQVGLA
jgi:3-phosphoshikimate 1-carboxyvinyltransferase